MGKVSLTQVSLVILNRLDPIVEEQGGILHKKQNNFSAFPSFTFLMYQIFKYWPTATLFVYIQSIWIGRCENCFDNNQQLLDPWGYIVFLK